jgi:hypothetical protein
LISKLLYQLHIARLSREFEKRLIFILKLGNVCFGSFPSVALGSAVDLSFALLL